MDIISICVSFIVAIFGIAYPILFQVVSGLDEKYSSEIIYELFNKEKIIHFFRYLLGASIVAIAVWLLKLPPLVSIKKINFIIENSATYLLGIVTLVLLISFLFFVAKILIYYTPSQLLKYLINKYKKDDKVNDFINFRAISDLLYFSIRKQNKTLCDTISDFMYWSFQNYREMELNKPIEYPTAFYEVVNRTILELAPRRNNKFIFLEHRTVGGIWLLGETSGSKISDKTYSWLWYNLYEALEYDRDDMIIYYWQNAHQIISFALSKIDPEYSDDFSITNNDQIEEREKDRNRFFEFHYALGGLLFYKQRFNCISRIFKYTTSIPPRYELLPISMEEIFNRFVDFHDPYGMEHYLISYKYNFPGMEGQIANSIIKTWICKYVAILFLRQYSIIPYLSLIKPLELPAIPSKQNEKKKWIHSLNFFKKLVTEVYNDQNLLNQVGLGFLNDKWCTDNNKPMPLELFDKLKSNIEESFEETLIKQSISEKKAKIFYESTKTILTKAINTYQKIYNQNSLEGELNSQFIQGERIIMEKAAFADNQEASVENYDTFLAERFTNKYGQGIAETFYANQSQSYLLKPEDIFPAIDRLKITNNVNEYIIVGFGQNISYFINVLKVKGLTENNYKGIEIINFFTYDRRQFGQIFFIIKKADLPQFTFKPTDNNQLIKYSLSEIVKEFKIYSSVIDLNINESLRKELEPIEPNSDLRKSVLVCISIKVEIKWKRNEKVVLFSNFSPHREGGLLNNLDEIKEF